MQQNKPIRLDLDLGAASLVIDALADRPYRQVHQLIPIIQMQVQIQVNQPPPEPEKPAEEAAPAADEGSQADPVEQPKNHEEA